MFTRLYVDNFRCLVNFEFRPKQKPLIIGGNGTGKSTFLEILTSLRGFVNDPGVDVEQAFGASTLTRWETRAQQTFSVEAVINHTPYQYGLVTEHNSGRARVHSEVLFIQGEPLLQASGGDVRLYNAKYPSGVGYPFG
jgi:predicted ATPase